MSKAHTSKVTHKTAKKYFHHLERRGYNKNSVLGLYHGAWGDENITTSVFTSNRPRALDLAYFISGRLLHFTPFIFNSYSCSRDALSACHECRDSTAGLISVADPPLLCQLKISGITDTPRSISISVCFVCSFIGRLLTVVVESTTDDQYPCVTSPRVSVLCHLFHVLAERSAWLLASKFRL